MNILKAKKIYFIISAVIILVGIIAYIAFGGLNFGLDFSGGTEIRINIGKDFDNAAIEKIVKDTSGETPTVQKTNGTEVSIKTKEIATEKRDAVIDAIKANFGLDDSSILEATNVSASASTKLLLDALKAILLSVVCMLVYITFRFDFRSGLAAILGLLHNVLIMIAIYAIFRMQINSSFIAAILTIVGYSINNTIVIFDKIRENRKQSQRVPFEEVSALALKQTMTRTIFASITTLTTIVVLFILGVPSIKEFSLPIIIGVVVGTYSSICISTPLWVILNDKLKKRSKKKA